MTDNGACYRSKKFAAALGKDVQHRRTRRYRPQTNGKVERFNRTLASEWAYAQPYPSETAARPPTPAGSTPTITPTPHRDRRRCPR